MDGKLTGGFDQDILYTSLDLSKMILEKINNKKTEDVMKGNGSDEGKREENNFILALNRI